jgi:hypothetical protein
VRQNTSWNWAAQILIPEIACGKTGNVFLEWEITLSPSPGDKRSDDNCWVVTVFMCIGISLQRIQATQLSEIRQ